MINQMNKAGVAYIIKNLQIVINQMNKVGIAYIIKKFTDSD